MGLTYNPEVDDLDFFATSCVLFVAVEDNITITGEELPKLGSRNCNGLHFLNPPNLQDIGII